MSQTSYQRNFDSALPGQIMGTGSYADRSLLNTASQSPQKFTYTPVSGGTAAATYTTIVNISGKSTVDTSAITSFTASHTAAQLVAALAASLNLVDGVFDSAAAIASATAVTLSGRKKDTAFALSTTVATAGTGAATVTTAQTAAAVASEIPFGRFVAGLPTDAYDVARLPASTSVTAAGIHGVTLTTQYSEKTSIGPNATSAYKSGEVMDVVSKTLSNDGVMVECIETDITWTDTLYVSIAAGSEGKASKSSSGSAINLSSKGKFKGAARSSAGKTVVLVELS